MKCSKPIIKDLEREKAKTVAYGYLCESQQYCWIYKTTCYAIANEFNEIPTQATNVEFIHTLGKP